MNNRNLAASCQYPARRIPGPARHVWWWLLVSLTWPVAVAAQQDSMKGCNLLTPAELSAAIGGSVGHALGQERPYKKFPPMIDHDGVVYTCTEAVGTHKVVIHYNTSPVTAAGKKFALDHSKEAEDDLRKQGYQIQTKDLSGSHCTTIVPGAGTKDTLEDVVGTACVREKGPYVVSVYVSATGTSDMLSMERVGALTEKAVSRVPAQ